MTTVISIILLLLLILVVIKFQEVKRRIQSWKRAHLAKRISDDVALCITVMILKIFRIKTKQTELSSLPSKPTSFPILE